MERPSSSLQHFDVNTSGERLGSEWKKWIRALNLNLVAKDINDDKRKVATLLSSGGPALQEIYYSLIGELIEESFEDVQERLTSHFVDETIDTFERHLYRQIKQKTDESFDRFVLRIRLQSEKCNFGIRVSEFIRDQVVEGSLHDKVREEIFKVKDCTLEEALHIGRTNEMIADKMKEFKKLETRRIEKDDISWVSKPHPGQKRVALESAERCYRCNRSGHRADSEKCSARLAKCRKCQKMGHFEVACQAGGKRGNWKRFKPNYQVS